MKWLTTRKMLFCNYEIPRAINHIVITCYDNNWHPCYWKSSKCLRANCSPSITFHNNFFNWDQPQVQNFKWKNPKLWELTRTLINALVYLKMTKTAATSTIHAPDNRKILVRLLLRKLLLKYSVRNGDSKYLKKNQFKVRPTQS